MVVFFFSVLHYYTVTPLCMLFSYFLVIRGKEKQIKDNIYGLNFVQMWKIGSFINSFYGWPKRKKKGWPNDFWLAKYLFWRFSLSLLLTVDSLISFMLKCLCLLWHWKAILWNMCLNDQAIILLIVCFNWFTWENIVCLNWKEMIQRQKYCYL